MTEPTNLSAEEQQIFKAIEKNDHVLLKTLFTEKRNVNIVDENSLYPLQHAAYKGNSEMVQFLLDQGADVNLCQHQHDYTALHFAALSGSTDTCLALLNAGAKSAVVNTVGRTPAQIAVFVGHYHCTAFINNYVPKQDIECFTTAAEPVLPPFIVDSFHKFILQVNLHPVKVLLNLQQFVGLMDHLSDVQQCLKLMCHKEMKRGTEIGEILAFKFHYLGYLVGEIIKIQQKQTEDKKLDLTELFSRKILKPGKDGSLDFMDAFLKEGIRKFEFIDSNLFRQVVASVAANEGISAISAIAAAINGQRSFVEKVICSTCGEEKPKKKCSKCRAVNYCDRYCQKLHWHWHKKECDQLALGVLETEQAAPNANEISADLQKMLV